MGAARKSLLVVALLLPVLLAACADDEPAPDPTQQNFDPSTISKKDADHIKDPTPICPQVAIVRDLDSISDYGGEEPDPAQLVSEARMKKIEGDCAYNKGNIDVRFSIDFAAARGPRLGGLHTSFPYFVAVLDPRQKILNKVRMNVDFGFSSSSNFNTGQEDLHIVIPLSDKERPSGPNYQVLVGFQLSKQQYEVLRGEKPATPADETAAKP